MARPSSNLNSSGSAPSKVDAFSGDHTVSIIVGALFALVLITFALIYVFKENVSETVITSFFTLLGVLGGFFVSSVKKSNK